MQWFNDLFRPGRAAENYDSLDLREMKAIIDLPNVIMLLEYENAREACAAQSQCQKS